MIIDQNVFFFNFQLGFCQKKWFLVWFWLVFHEKLNFLFSFGLIYLKLKTDQNSNLRLVNVEAYLWCLRESWDILGVFQGHFVMLWVEVMGIMESLGVFAEGVTGCYGVSQESSNVV